MSKSDSAKAREHRLAAKLRENLRRRKAPAAGQEADGPAAVKAQGDTQKDSRKG